MMAKILRIEACCDCGIYLSNFRQGQQYCRHLNGPDQSLKTSTIGPECPLEDAEAWATEQDVPLTEHPDVQQLIANVIGARMQRDMYRRALEMVMRNADLLFPRECCDPEHEEECKAQAAVEANVRHVLKQGDKQGHSSEKLNDKYILHAEDRETIKDVIQTIGSCVASFDGEDMVDMYTYLESAMGQLKTVLGDPKPTKGGE